MSDLLEGFNPGQKSAVEYCDGPLLVIAGAGSGKTRVLTSKVAYLIQEKGYQPYSILALTFTNKAANEMKERISQRVGEYAARYVWMGTFHSVFLRILRMEHEAIGFDGNFTIYDQSDSRSLMKSIIKEQNLDDKVYKPSTVLDRISNAKNQLVTAEEYISNPATYQNDLRERMPETGNLFKLYEDRCKSSNAMDFDDILVFTYKLFKNNPDILNKYASRFKYVLVDEYQDTNYAQHQIVWQLTSEHRHVCVVGDDAQSIYSFRGANINNILTFQKLYEGAKLFKLEQNYRSTKNIVNAANSLISKNSMQIRKNVFSDNEDGDKIRVYESSSDKEEASIVRNNIKIIVSNFNEKYSDIAVLYRTNAQSRIFEEVFRDSGIPYRIFGGLSFFQRKEIKDVIGYFRLAVNPDDEEALRRVINYPARGIGNTTVGKISAIANSAGVSLWRVISNPVYYGLSVSGKSASSLRDFSLMISDYIKVAQEQTADIAGDEIIKRCGIINEIYRDKTPENLSRQENIEELRTALYSFVKDRQEEGSTNLFLVDYLSEALLATDLESDNTHADTDEEDEENKVTLMTVHSAKGLEFTNVFVVGLEENLFPSQMSGSSMKEMEEERRLFYVAITRAKKRCFLSYAKTRFRYGKCEFGNPSRFLRDIDSCYLSHQNMFRQEKKSKEPELPWVRRPRQIISTDSVVRPENKTSRTLKPVTSMPSSSSSVGNASVANISVGTEIEHERFGHGTVKKLDGVGDMIKATIEFRFVGEKVLLLKYAKFKIIK